GGLRPQPDHHAAHAPERHGALPDHADVLPWAGHSARGIAVLPRTRCPRTDGGLGSVAEGGGRRICLASTVDGGGFRPRPPPGRVRLESLRRFPSGRSRPETPHALTTRAARPASVDSLTPEGQVDRSSRVCAPERGPGNTSGS